MDDKMIAEKVAKIAKLEAAGDAQGAGTLKQELFTNGVDFPDIEAMVKKAGGKRAKEGDGTFKADDPKTPNTNEAFETGKSPAEKPGTKPAEKSAAKPKVAAKPKAAAKPKPKAKTKAKAKKK